MSDFTDLMGPWIELGFWSLATLYFLERRAWLPAIPATLAVINTQLAASPFGRPTFVFLTLLFLLPHVVLRNRNEGDSD